MRIAIIIASALIITACASEARVNSDLNLLSSEMGSMQATIDDLQYQLDELTIRNEILNVEVAKSNQLVYELETDLTYLHSELALMRKTGGSTPNQTSGIIVHNKPVPTIQNPKQSKEPATEDKKPKVIVVDDTKADKLSLYSHALDLYNHGKYNDSIGKFNEFLTAYPKDSMAVNAQYWIGENYYSLKNYNKAIDEFKMVMSKYPKGSKVPDAMLKLGYSYLNIGKNEQGKDTLNQLIENYPKTNAANIAENKLKSI